MSNFWKEKKVLVTGGTGFLGKHLVDKLVENGAIVHILDFCKPSEEIINAVFFEADIRDKDRVARSCRDIDIVFHLAAMPSIARGKFQQYYQINVLGTKNILEAAYKSGVKKFIHVSSSTVYGIPKEFPLKETSEVKPLGKYSGTKLEAENLCREFTTHGLDISIIRPRVIIGPGRIGIFSILFDRVIANKPIYLFGRGNNIFQFTNVFDMVSACIKAAELKGADLFNVGSNEILPVKKEIKQLLAHAKSNSRIICIPALLARTALKTLSCLGISPLVDEQFNIADKNFKLDTQHAEKNLNWHPQYSNVDSLIQAYDWYIVNRNKELTQYKSLFGIIGKFKHSRMGAFQNH